MRFFLAPLASLLSLAVFWTSWRGAPAPDVGSGGVIFSLGLAVVGLFLGLWARSNAVATGESDQAEGRSQNDWREQLLSHTRGPWALIAIVIGLTSLILQVLALATPFGARLRG